jgi:hypothetical protein
VFTIIAQYQAEYRGLAEYYRMAHNLRRLNELKRTIETRAPRQLKTSVSDICRRYNRR